MQTTGNHDFMYAMSRLQGPSNRGGPGIMDPPGIMGHFRHNVATQCVVLMPHLARAYSRNLSERHFEERRKAVASIMAVKVSFWPLRYWEQLF